MSILVQLSDDTFNRTKGIHVGISSYSTYVISEGWVLMCRGAAYTTYALKKINR